MEPGGWGRPGLSPKVGPSLARAVSDAPSEAEAVSRPKPGSKAFSVNLGVGVEGAVDHRDSGLVVDRFGRQRHAGCSSFGIGHSVLRRRQVIQVQEVGESTGPGVSPSPVGGIQPTTSCPKLRIISKFPALSPTETAGSDGRRSASANCPIQ